MQIELKEDTLTDEEKIAYKRFQENRRIERSEIETALKEGEEQGMEKKEVEFVLNLHADGFQIEEISKLTKISFEKVKEIIKNFA